MLKKKLFIAILCFPVFANSQPKDFFSGSVLPSLDETLLDFQKELLGPPFCPFGSSVLNEPLEGQDSFFSSDEFLIGQHIDPKWPKPKPPLEMSLKRRSPLIFAEGSRTRGGGSGLQLKSENGIEVKLLEIYRSEKTETYPNFFQLDSKILELENQGPPEVAAKAIFGLVLSRIREVAPNLAHKIQALAEREMPFSQWTPILEGLPLIEDETPYPHETNKEKIQIASRRTDFILYSEQAYLAMSPVNRAALWLHEYLYALTGLEKSIFIQRAVSLFFSAEFFTLARADLPRLTQLFFEFQVLGLSRPSIENSLPKGASLADSKQKNNCGRILSMSASEAKDRFHIKTEIDGKPYQTELNKNEATIFSNSLMWAKIFLGAKFPIYKYPAQRIDPDRVCFDRSLKKITQIQSSISRNKKLAELTRKVAEAEVAHCKLRSETLKTLRSMKEGSLDPAKTVGSMGIGLMESKSKLRRAALELDLQNLNIPEIISTSEILGEYNVDIRY